MHLLVLPVYAGHDIDQLASSNYMCVPPVLFWWQVLPVCTGSERPAPHMYQAGLLHGRRCNVYNAACADS